MGITVRFTDTGASPITEIDAGQSFRIYVEAQDLRGTPQGVAGAFVDVLYNTSLADVTGIQWVLAGKLTQTGTVNDAAGLVDEVGAWSMTAPADPSLAQPIFYLEATAVAGGTLTVQTADGTAALSENTLFGADDPVDAQTNYGSGQLTIIGAALPTVTVSEAPSAVSEDGGASLVYTFSRSGDNSAPLTVIFTVGGTATSGSDYTQTGADTFTVTTGTVTFLAGSSTALVTVAPTADTEVEPDETVVLTLAAGSGYDIGTPASASATIINDDTSVSVAVAPASVLEDGTDTLVYTFTRTGVTTGVLAVDFAVSGEAQYGSDYTATGAGTFTVTAGTITFGASVDTVQVIVDPTADPVTEPDETVVLTVSAGTGYTVGSPASASGTIANDDNNGNPPTANPGGPYSVGEGGSLVLNGSGSFDPDGDPLTYAWDLNGDGQFDDSTEMNPVFSAAGLDGPLVVNISLRVTDSNLNTSAAVSTTVTVGNVAPTGTMTKAFSYQGVRGQTLLFNLAALDPSAADMAGAFTYTIDWGDGQQDVLDDEAASTTASHVYTAEGSYTPTVRVTDKDGAAGAVADGPAMSIQIAEQQGANIAIGGTSNADNLVLAQVWRAGTFSIDLNTQSHGTKTLSRDGQVLYFGQGGSDTAELIGTSAWDRFETTPAGMKLNGFDIAVDSVDAWTLSGGAGVDTFVGPSTGGTWALGAADAGSVGAFVFTSMEKLIGGTSADQFEFSNTTRTYMAIDGGTGSGVVDEFDYSGLTRAVTVNVGASVATGAARFLNIESFVGTTAARSLIRAGNGTNTWTVTGPNAGTVNNKSFTDFGDLVGGRGSDHFAFFDGASANLVDGGGGADVLNFSARTDGVDVSLAAGTAKDLDTSASIVADLRHFRMVIGTAMADAITASDAAAALLLGGAGNDTLTGGAKKDILIGGSGADTLNGMGQQDILYGGLIGYYDEANGELLDQRALDMILQSWNSNAFGSDPDDVAQYSAKVGWMITRPWVAGADLEDDLEADELWGGANLDLFLLGEGDTVLDHTAGEIAVNPDDL